MKKILKKSVIFGLTLLMTTPIVSATTLQYHKQYEKMIVKDTGAKIYSYVGEDSPTGITISTEVGDFWNQDVFLKEIYETHRNSRIGLSQIINTHDGRGKDNYEGFIGEAFVLNQTRLFYTTKDVKKSILPTKDYIKPITYSSKYTPTFNGYTISLDDAKKVVVEYAKENKVSNYYYKSIDIMSYDGERDENGQRSGYGKMYNLDGDLIYAGMWKNGVFDGYGITFLDGEATYIGNWSNGLPNGIGIVKMNPNSKYYTEMYSYIDGYNSINRITKSLDKKGNSVDVPFKNKKNLLHTISDFDEQRLIEICNGYERFSDWQDKKIKEMIEYKSR